MAAPNDPRIHVENEAPLRPSREFVLCWTSQARRTRWNRALSRAVSIARSIGRPLLVLETLRCDDRYASARSHRFLLDGMADQTARFESAGVAYYPYVEPVPGAAEGLPFALAESACAIVSDEATDRDAARERAAAAARFDVRVESVDGTGVLPRSAIRDTVEDFSAFRGRLRSALPALVLAGAEPDPLATPMPRRLERLPKEVADRWHPARKALLDGDPALLARLAINGAVAPSDRRGGEVAARAAWGDALRAPPSSVPPDVDAWVSAGHLSAEEIAHDLLLRDGCIPSVDLKPSGDGPGWWHVRAAADRFLERIIVGREHALHRAQRCARDPNRYENLPPATRRALEARAADPARPRVDVAALEAANGNDPRWNALQRALRERGVLSPTERTAWARGLLESAPTPRDAFDLALHLLSLYALGGRDPFAQAEVAWAFLDAAPPPIERRPAGPERRGIRELPRRGGSPRPRRR